MSITITTVRNHIYLQAPYLPAANGDYKHIGGRWDGTERAWKFAAVDADKVRAVCLKHFGYHDQTPADRVTVRVTLPAYEQDQEVFLLGRKLAWRPGRDLPVRLGDDVVVAEGRFSGSGGSQKYPSVGDTAGVVLEVRGVPASHRDLEDDNVEVVPSEPTGADVEALMAERERLVQRLAEIDAQLPEPEGVEASTRQAAEVLGVSVRTVQRWAAAGQVAATKKRGGHWAITITLPIPGYVPPKRKAPATAS